MPIDHALSLVGPLTKHYAVYLRLEADEFGRSLPGEAIGSEAEAKIRAARLLQRHGVAEIAHYRTIYGMEYVIKRANTRLMSGSRN